MPKITPLSKREHANVKVKAQTHFDEFTNVSVLPVYAYEAASIARTHPLVFIKNDENFSLALPCSLSEKLPSAWISKEGKWLTEYVPAAIKQRPFTVLLQDKDRDKDKDKDKD